MPQLDVRREPHFGADIGDRMQAPIASRGMPSGLGAEWPVLDAQSLIDRLGLGNAIRCLRIKLAFPAEVFALAVQPLIDGHAEFVQMLPRSGSGQHGQAGGQLHRALATALRSLDRRRGQILPRGAAPEVIGAQAHRWTYAVFVAALLRDLPYVSDGMRVWMAMGTGVPRAWNPAAGSMRVLRRARVCRRVLATWGGAGPVRCGCGLGDFRALRAGCHPGLAQGGSCIGGRTASVPEWQCRSGQRPQRVGGKWDSPRRPPGRAQAVSATPVVPAATPVVAVSSPETQSVLAVDPPEFLEDVSPDESALARQFMAWLSQGMLDGRLSVNEPDALVHVVAEGLLLASPRIFREFAKQQVGVPESAADAAKRVQREVLREGWHLRADRGVNILCYERKRSDRGSTRINGIVIREPQRFIQALPAIDSALVRVVEGASVPT
jgi:hypothetical protein